MEWVQNQLKNRISLDPSKTNRADIYKYLFILCYVIISTSVIFALFLNNAQFANNPSSYVSSILFFTVIGFAIYYSLFRDLLSNKQGFIQILVAMILFGFVSYAYFHLPPVSLSYVNYAIYGIVGLMIIVALTIVYQIYSQKILRMQGTGGFWIQMLFYIPCLFSMLVEYIKKEFAITPSVVYILLFIEIILIAFYFLIPKMTKSINRLNKSVVRMEPIQLNKETVIANSDLFIVSPTSGSLSNLTTYHPTIQNPTGLDNNVYRNSNYAISFWAFINPSTTSNSAYVKESTIFDYAGGKPKLTFMNKGNQQYFTAYLSNRSPEKSKYQIVLPTQKWNYFVFNYTNGQVDLFVNGNLEKNMLFLEDNVPLNSTEMDTMKVGSANGLNGYICNINYHQEPLSALTISYNYNLLMMTNPPLSKI
jgi:hypothetical protein